jgi:hypothetical protein
VFFPSSVYCCLFWLYIRRESQQQLSRLPCDTGQPEASMAISWHLYMHLDGCPFCAHPPWLDSCCASSFMLAPASSVTFVCVALDAAVGFAYGTTDGQPPQCGIGWWAGRKSRLYRSPPYTALVLEALLHHTHTHIPFILCLPLFRPVSVFLFSIFSSSRQLTRPNFLFLLPLNYILPA